MTSSFFNLPWEGRVIGRNTNPSGPPSYYHFDHLGSVRAVVSTTGAITESYDFEPWGLLMPGRTFGSGTKEWFTGKERDAETGLDYFGARYYMAALGRWTGVDPEAATTPEWSTYSYVFNNPIGYIDAFGKQAESIVKEANTYWDNVAIAGHQQGGVRGFFKAAFATAMSSVIEYGGLNAMDAGTDAMAEGRWVAGGVQTLLGAASMAPLPFIDDAVRALGQVDNVAGQVDNLAQAGRQLDDAAQSGRRIPNSDLAAPPSARGRAPTGKDGHPVELHHRNQNPAGPLDEMTRAEHRGGGNFKKNHPNTGQRPSKIDRKKWRQEQRQYWKREWDSDRFKDLSFVCDGAMGVREVLIGRKPALTGRFITAEERRLLQEEFSGKFDVTWLLDLMSEFPLVDSVFTLDENNDRSELGVEMKWLKPADILTESREVAPGPGAIGRGYLPVGECLLGSGDPYFVKVSNGNDPTVVRIPHDAPDEVELVTPTLSEFFRAAGIE